MLAPSAGYLADIWAATARAVGLGVEVEMVRPGFYPRGGGELRATIGARRPETPISWLVRGGPACVRARAAVARLPRHIAERMLRAAAEQIQAAGLPLDPERDGEIVDHGGEARSPGAYLELVLDVPPVPAGFIGLGDKGVPAEVVAGRAAADLLRHAAGDAPVDPHLGDQLAILLALSANRAPSRYRTSEVTLYLRTHAALLEALWPVEVAVLGEIGQPGEVRVTARA